MSYRTVEVTDPSRKVWLRGNLESIYIESKSIAFPPKPKGSVELTRVVLFLKNEKGEEVEVKGYLELTELIGER